MSGRWIVETEQCAEWAIPDHRYCQLRKGHPGAHLSKLDACWVEAPAPLIDNCHLPFGHDGPHLAIDAVR